MALLAALPGCKDRSTATATRTDVYVVRGQVVQLPDPADPRAEFQVRHEPIPHFRGQGGELGMDTMVMPFPIGAGFSLEGLRVGDRIELTFEVEFDASADRLMGYRATRAVPLPAGTELDFTPMSKRPASPQTPAEPTDAGAPATPAPPARP